MRNESYLVLTIKAVSSVSAVYTCTHPIFIYHQHQTIGAISTALITVPSALFGLYAVFVTLPIDKRFSVLAMLFVVLTVGAV